MAGTLPPRCRAWISSEASMAIGKRDRAAATGRVARALRLLMVGREGAGWERLRFEDHFLNVSRKDISADVPMRLNIGVVGPPDGIGRDFRDDRPERPQFHV